MWSLIASLIAFARLVLADVFRINRRTTLDWLWEEPHLAMSKA